MAASKPYQLKGRNRLRLILLGFALCFSVLLGRAVQLAILSPLGNEATQTAGDSFRIPRPDITDRNGRLLATDVQVASLYANPRKIIDIDEAVELLSAVLPELDTGELRAKLQKDKAFVWIKRDMSPEQRDLVHNQGVPGVYFRDEQRRIYPMGRLGAHVIGFVDIDSFGLAGMEKYLDDRGALYTASLAVSETQTNLPAQISIDMRIQHVLTDELSKAVKKFKAQAAAGVILDVRSGEVLALASLPDYNPNNPRDALNEIRMNRVTTGVFELGSVIKAVTFAMALDSGTTTLEGRFDARGRLHIGNSSIGDFHAKNRVLTVPEIFLFSSNIGTARMALAVGLERHKQFLHHAGLLSKLTTELPEAASPLRPARWNRLSSATASFGHGFAVQPLQGVMVTAALINGGRLIPPTFLKRSGNHVDDLSRRLIKKETSKKMRYLFRLNAQQGTARRASVPGYRVGGKTGTAEKVINGAYSKDHVLTSFVGGFPMDDPKYAMIVMLDDPRPLPETHGYKTSGWNAVPMAGRIIRRIAPILGVMPKLTDADRQKLAAEKKAKKL